MNLKKKLAFLLCAGMILSAGCSTAVNGEPGLTELTGETDTAENVTGETTEEEGVIISNEENVKLLGRTYLDENNVLWCALSGTGIEFSFKGKSADITVKGDSSASASNIDNNPRIAVYVDGERKIDDMLDTSEERVYTVSDLDPEKESVVRVVKLSESAMSTFGITGIEIDGEDLKPAADKDMLIEFIGDSITCGYGVDDEVKENHFSTRTEDVTKTYAYKTAEAMNADYSMVSYSGYGIISGYSGNGEKVESQTLPQYYEKAGFSYGNMNGKQISEIEWDFSKRQPDIIVINLGTNDDSYTKNDSAKQEEYAAAYTEFIKQVRSSNPDAKIVCTLGIMGWNLYPYVEYAVYNYTEETGDANVTSMVFEPQNAEDGYAADWHPTEKTHGKAADALVKFLKELDTGNE